MAKQLTEHDAEDFLREYVPKSEDDLFLALANSVRFTPELREPIRGYGDRVEVIVEYLKKEYKKLIDKFCEMYRRRELSNFMEDFKSALNDSLRFVLLANAVVIAAGEIGFAKLPTFDTDTIGILTSLIWKLGLARDNFDDFCGRNKQDGDVG